MQPIGEKQNISNVPVILLPLGRNGNVSFALRPIITHNFVPGRPALPGKEFQESSLASIRKKLTSLSNVENVILDLTFSPISVDPLSIEWEK